MEVRICFSCGYPVVFRGRPPHIYHLGSGWPCWQLQQAGLLGPGSKANLRIESVTPKAACAARLEEAQALYHDYLHHGDPAPVLELAGRLIADGQVDCLARFLAWLAAESSPRGQLLAGQALVRRLVASRPWQKYVCRRQIEEVYGRYAQSGDTASIGRLVAILDRTRRVECLHGLAVYLDEHGVPVPGRESIPPFLPGALGTS